MVTSLSGCAELFKHDLRDMADTHILVRDWFAPHERKFNLQNCFPFFSLKSIISSGEVPCQFLLQLNYLYFASKTFM